MYSRGEEREGSFFCFFCPHLRQVPSLAGPMLGVVVPQRLDEEDERNRHLFDTFVLASSRGGQRFFFNRIGDGGGEKHIT